jgi:hypothetical protein
MILILALLLFGRHHPVGKDFVPPRSGGRLGCSASLDTTAGVSWWHVHITSTYADGSKWAKLFTVRYPKDTQKALKDCADWVEGVSLLENTRQ